MPEVATIQTAQVATQPPETSDPLISMIERAARDASVDIDKMERLFQMHERAEERRSVIAFNTALADAQSQAEPVARNKRNQQTSSNYADLAAICDAVMPIVHSAGLSLSFSEFESTRPGHMGVRCAIKHALGHGETHDFHIPFDDKGMKGNVNKTATHAYGSTFSYGRRYATLAVLNISTTDDDGQKAGRGAPISDEQAAALAAKFDEVEADIPKFCKYFSIDRYVDLPATEFDRAMTALAKKAQS
jgi:hypothetical protein